MMISYGPGMIMIGESWSTTVEYFNQGAVPLLDGKRLAWRTHVPPSQTGTPSSLLEEKEGKPIEFKPGSFPCSLGSGTGFLIFLVEADMNTLVPSLVK